MHQSGGEIAKTWRYTRYYSPAYVGGAGFALPFCWVGSGDAVPASPATRPDTAGQLVMALFARGSSANMHRGICIIRYFAG